MNNAHAGQKDLIHGIDLSSGTPIDENTLTLGNKWVTNPFNGKKMIIKMSSKAESGLDTPKSQWRANQDKLGMLAPDGLNSARREVLTHNLAHDLGLGNFFPTTAGFTKNGEDYSAQEKVSGISPRSILKDWDGNGKYKDHYHKTMSALHDSGNLHKLAIFDALMGNEDRHSGNYIIDHKEPHVYMIDHGRTVDYNQAHGSLTPHFLRYAEENLNSKQVHDKARNWLNSLNQETVSKMFDKYIEPGSKFEKNFIDRLNNLRNSLANSENKDWNLSRHLNEVKRKNTTLAASRNDKSDLKKV